MDKNDMLKRFAELKAKGGKITLGDLMSDEQKKRSEEQKKTLMDVHRHIDSNLYTKKEVKRASEKVRKFFDKLSLSKNVKTILMIDDISFFFEFEENSYYITYDIESECMTINDGTEFDEDSAHEIGFYELEENYF